MTKFVISTVKDVGIPVHTREGWIALASKPDFEVGEVW
ncbi:hypothetical protein SAMN05444415_103157 [Salipiger profundus]|jgi:hypothetical protein|nr:hypothetical protein SAMN05444415_103157 [Salipiger profundus]